MNKLPLYRQQQDNTCALACLRMVLAAFGTIVEESTLQTQARLEDEGTSIDELERLARGYRLSAQIRETTLEELANILAEGKLPIAYLDRGVFDLRPRQKEPGIRFATRSFTPSFQQRSQLSRSHSTTRACRKSAEKAPGSSVSPMICSAGIASFVGRSNGHSARPRLLAADNQEPEPDGLSGVNHAISSRLRRFPEPRR